MMISECLSCQTDQSVLFLKSKSKRRISEAHFSFKEIFLA